MVRSAVQLRGGVEVFSERDADALQRDLDRSGTNGKLDLGHGKAVPCEQVRAIFARGA